MHFSYKCILQKIYITIIQRLNSESLIGYCFFHSEDYLIALENQSVII